MSDLRSLLQAVADDNGGRLTPALVVEEARPSDHPLHSRFEWNDAIAGEGFRRRQAQELIQSVRIVHRREFEPDLSIRAYHAVQDEAGYAYRPFEDVISDPILTKLLLLEMERDWKSLMKRYKDFVEFRELVMRDLAETA